MKHKTPISVDSTLEARATAKLKETVLSELAESDRPIQEILNEDNEQTDASQELRNLSGHSKSEGFKGS